jgi:hypothetical protein
VRGLVPGRIVPSPDQVIEPPDRPTAEIPRSIARALLLLIGTALFLLVLSSAASALDVPSGADAGDTTQGGRRHGRRHHPGRSATRPATPPRAVGDTAGDTTQAVADTAGATADTVGETAAAATDAVRDTAGAAMDSPGANGSSCGSCGGSGGNVNQSNDADTTAWAGNSNCTSQSVKQDQDGRIRGHGCGGCQPHPYDCEPNPCDREPNASAFASLSPGTGGGDVTRSSDATTTALAGNWNDTAQSVDQTQFAAQRR